MQKQEAITIVENYLARHQPSNYRLVVVPDASHEEEGWWHVAVGPDRPDIRRYDYYDRLAQVEREIEDELEVNIALFPPPSGVVNP